MTTCAKRLRVPAISLLLAACVFVPARVTAQQCDPHTAAYRAAADSMFWFLHASDLHIGMRGTTDSTRLQWLVTTAKTVINPSFIVVTGDLTDSTNGNFFGIPNGPYQAEWDQYKKILSDATVTPDWYFDLPGNHDAYSDQSFRYYKANSIQGFATKSTQVSWDRAFAFGNYHFLGVNSAGNDGRAFSASFPYGDYAGLDADELAFIDLDLAAHQNDALTFVFGHHPVTDTGVSGDTWLFYGQDTFVPDLGLYGASTYNYGHTHRTSQALFKGNAYTGTISGDGIYYYNVASLSKDSGTGYSLVAVDCNGVSSITRGVNAWPLVLMTAPVDKYIGGAVNPYAYTVPASSANFVRALAFDSGTISQVRFRIDGGVTWYPMSRVAGSPGVWQGAWDASSLTAGNHTVEVQATGTTTVSDSITVEVTSVGNRAPVAANDSYSAQSGKMLSVGKPGVLGNDTDPDGNPLTSASLSGPAHGTLVLRTDGSFDYTPNTGYAGTDTFTYTASDGTATSNTATVSISVAGPADTVTIATATWTRSTRRLLVEAHSSAEPNATLTVQDYRAKMTWTGTLYTYGRKTSSAPATVTVVSDRGGSATMAVTTK